MKSLTEAAEVFDKFIDDLQFDQYLKWVSNDPTGGRIPDLVQRFREAYTDEQYKEFIEAILEPFSEEQIEVLFEEARKRRRLNR